MSENHYAEFSECSMKPQEVLEYVSGPIPVPEEGEVLVRMKAAPINPADINFVQGVYGLKPVLPHSRAGLEGCGVVQESRAEGFREGDEVILLRGVGSWSEYVAVPSVNVMKLPVKVDPVQAAMLKVNPLTALRMLEGFVSLTPGDWVVQNASNAGVGRCIIQLAREMGVKTVMVTGDNRLTAAAIAAEAGVAAELVGDAEELVVLGRPLGTGGSASLQQLAA